MSDLSDRDCAGLSGSVSAAVSGLPRAHDLSVLPRAFSMFDLSGSNLPGSVPGSLSGRNLSGSVPGSNLPASVPGSLPGSDLPASVPASVPGSNLSGSVSDPACVPGVPELAR